MRACDILLGIILACLEDLVVMFVWLLLEVSI